MKKWECFLDMSYYDFWAVRPVGCRKLSESIHVQTKKEAEFLVDSLNELEEYKQKEEKLDKTP